MPVGERRGVRCDQLVQRGSVRGRRRDAGVLERHPQKRREARGDDVAHAHERRREVAPRTCQCGRRRLLRGVHQRRTQLWRDAHARTGHMCLEPHSHRRDAHGDRDGLRAVGDLQKRPGTRPEDAAHAGVQFDARHPLVDRHRDRHGLAPQRHRGGRGARGAERDRELREREGQPRHVGQEQAPRRQDRAHRLGRGQERADERGQQGQHGVGGDGGRGQRHRHGDGVRQEPEAPRRDGHAQRPRARGVFAAHERPSRTGRRETRRRDRHLHRLVCEARDRHGRVPQHDRRAGHALGTDVDRDGRLGQHSVQHELLRGLRARGRAGGRGAQAARGASVDELLKDRPEHKVELPAPHTQLEPRVCPEANTHGRRHTGAGARHKHLGAHPQRRRRDRVPGDEQLDARNARREVHERVVPVLGLDTHVRDTQLRALGSFRICPPWQAHGDFIE